jgi:hypothetical protein
MYNISFVIPRKKSRFKPIEFSRQVSLNFNRNLTSGSAYRLIVLGEDEGSESKNPDKPHPP